MVPGAGGVVAQYVMMFIVSWWRCSEAISKGLVLRVAVGLGRVEESVDGGSGVDGASFPDSGDAGRGSVAEPFDG